MVPLASKMFFTNHILTDWEVVNILCATWQKQLFVFENWSKFWMWYLRTIDIYTYILLNLFFLEKKCLMLKCSKARFPIFFYQQHNAEIFQYKQASQIAPGSKKIYPEKAKAAIFILPRRLPEKRWRKIFFGLWNEIQFPAPKHIT